MVNGLHHGHGVKFWANLSKSDGIEILKLVWQLFGSGNAFPRRKQGVQYLSADPNEHGS